MSSSFSRMSGSPEISGSNSASRIIAKQEGMETNSSFVSSAPSDTSEPNDSRLDAPEPKDGKPDKPRTSLEGEELSQVLSARRQKIESEADTLYVNAAVDVDSPPQRYRQADDGVDFHSVDVEGLTQQFSEFATARQQEAKVTKSFEETVDLSPENSMSSPGYKVQRRSGLIADAQSLADMRETLEMQQVSLNDEVQARETLKQMVLRESKALGALRAACEKEHRALHERLDEERRLREELREDLCSKFQSFVKLEHIEKSAEQVTSSPGTTEVKEMPHADLEVDAEVEQLSPSLDADQTTDGLDQHCLVFDQHLLSDLSRQVATVEAQLKEIESSVAASHAEFRACLAEYKTRQERQMLDAVEDTPEIPELEVAQAALRGKEICKVDVTEELRALTGRVATLYQVQSQFREDLDEVVNGRVAASEDAQAQLKEQLSKLTENFEDASNRQTDLRALLLEEVNQRGKFFDAVQRGLEDMLSQQLAKQEGILVARDEKIATDLKEEIIQRQEAMKAAILARLKKISL